MMASFGLNMVFTLAVTELLVCGGGLEDTNGTMWFNGYQPPVSSFKDGKWERHYPPGAGWLADVAQTSDGRIWAFGGAGIWSYLKGEEWVKEIGGSNTRGFIESPEGRYWRTNGGNVSYFDGNTWVSTPKPSPSAGNDLRFFEDDNGELWATGNGIYKWQETEKKWLEGTGSQARSQIDSMQSASFRGAQKALDGSWRIMSDIVPILLPLMGKNY